VIRVLAFLILFGAMVFGSKDDDLDGVPNSIDECPNTPFLHKVNSRGCTTKILTLPDQSDRDMKLFTLSYGRITDGDFEGREVQNEAVLSFSNISYPWIVSIKGGVRLDHSNNGLIDTTIKLKRIFKATRHLKINTLAGIKLPTYNFKGNRWDPLIGSSLYYYLDDKSSFFGGFNYTIVRDKEFEQELQDSYNIYGGYGYFLYEELYANISMNISMSKFKREKTLKTIGTMIIYQIKKSYSISLSFHKEIEENKHNLFNLGINYKF
jgi:hypothetical protein